MALSENEICGKKEWIKVRRFPHRDPLQAPENAFFVQIILFDRLFVRNLIFRFTQFFLLSDFYVNQLPGGSKKGRTGSAGTAWSLLMFRFLSSPALQRTILYPDGSDQSPCRAGCAVTHVGDDDADSGVARMADLIVADIDRDMSDTAAV